MIRTSEFVYSLICTPEYPCSNDFLLRSNDFDESNATKEITRIATEVLPEDRHPESRTIRDIARVIESVLPGKQTKIFFLSLVIRTESLWYACFGPDLDGSVIEILGGIAKWIRSPENRSSAAKTVDRFVKFVVREEIERSYAEYARKLRVPFYFPSAVPDVLVLAAGHYSEKWKKSFFRYYETIFGDERDPRVPEVEIYCVALSRAPSKMESEWSRRYEAAIWPKGNVPRDSFRRSLAFCSVYPDRVWKEMGWYASCGERNRMIDFAEKKVSYSKDLLGTMMFNRKFSP